MVQQSITLCLTFSGLGGLCKVLASVVLIVPDDREKKGEDVSKCTKAMALILNVGLQLLTAAFYTIAPWFGPVSLYRPTALSVVLLFNMFVVGVALKKEPFSKEMQVATYFSVLSVVILPILGPLTQDGQDVTKLLMTPQALTWMTLISVSFIASNVCMFALDLNKMKPMAKEMCLGGVGVLASVLSPTVTRIMVNVTGAARAIFIAVYVIIQIILVYEYILESTEVISRGKFIPTCAAGSLVLNALTGIILWEDWKVIQSWTGYVCTFLQILLSVYLLSDFEFSKKQQVQELDITTRHKKAILKSHGSSSLDRRETFRRATRSARASSLALLSIPSWSMRELYNCMGRSNRKVITHPQPDDNDLAEKSSSLPDRRKKNVRLLSELHLERTNRGETFYSEPDDDGHVTESSSPSHKEQQLDEIETDCECSV